MRYERMHSVLSLAVLVSRAWLWSGPLAALYVSTLMLLPTETADPADKYNPMRVTDYYSKALSKNVSIGHAHLNNALSWAVIQVERGVCSTEAGH